MKTIIGALSLAAALGAGSAMAAQPGVKIGTLTCKSTDITNAILVSSTTFDCTFAGSGDQPAEHYQGEISKIGVDLSIKNDVTMVWAVLAPSDSTYAPHALAGTYVGASADASLGVGGGAHVLVGGGDESFTLQPVSVTGIQGVGAALGIESFDLTAPS